MKLNKKLLVFLLSFCLLIGALVFSAFAAEGDPDVLTLKYQDGTVQTYAEGATIEAPAVPEAFLVFEEGKAYKYTVSAGAQWQGIPASVTASHMGQTLEVTVAGTKDARQVYYVTEETLGGVTTVVYHMNNDVDKYLSSSNKGDKGDGTNTGAASFEQMYPLNDTNFKTSLKIKLYSDVETSSFKTALYNKDARRSGITVYFDLNGHTVKNTSSSLMDYYGISLRIYSSVPGAHWYQTSSSSLARANDDATVIFGDREADAGNGGNISFHCKAISANNTQYGAGIYVWGGKFYQTGAAADGAFFSISRRAHALSNAEIYLLEGQAIFCDTETHNESPALALAKSTVRNCKFYSPAAGATVIKATKDAKMIFNNCTFINFDLSKATQGTAQITLKPTCVSSNSAMDEYDGYVFAKTAPYACEGLVKEDGTAIEATINCIMVPVAEALKITTTEGTGYYAVGAPFSASAGDYTKIEGAKIYMNPEYRMSGVSQIKNGFVVAGGEITLEVVFTLEDDLAFTYTNTSTNVLKGVPYQVECGGTAEGVGEKFYDLFNVPAAGYEIKMYKDMILSKAMAFGPLTLYSDSTHNRDYYNSMVNGSITWDLNGCTVTIASGANNINLNAANSAKNSTTQIGANFAFFGLEGGTANTLTLKSSAPGGKFMNLSSQNLFGIGEGRKSIISIVGENLTFESSTNIIRAHSSENGYKHVMIDGGTFIYHGTDGPIRGSGKGNVYKNATFVCTKNAAFILGAELYRNNVYTVENCVFVAPNAAPLFKEYGSYSASYFGTANKATVKDCAFVNVVPTANLVDPSKYNASPVTYTGANAFSTEENLALFYPTAPDGTAKYTFKVGVPNAEGGMDTYSVIGYAQASDFLAVTYNGAGITEYYLVGKYLVPLAMNSSYYTVTFNLAAGTANIPVIWEGLVPNSVLAQSGAVSVDPEDNHIPIAFALYDTVSGEVTGYARSDSGEIAALLASALSAQANAGKLYVYEDLSVGALTVGKALEVLLEGKQLLLSATLSVNAELTVQEGTIVSLAAVPFALSADVSLNGTNVYLAAATTVFGGTAGNASLTNVKLYNLASATMVASGVTASYNGGHVTGVALGSGVTVSGTVLGTDGTFAAGCAYGSGVISDVIIRESSHALAREDVITVLGETYTVAFTVAATDDASLVVNVTYVNGGVVRGEHKYFYGSVPSFYSEYAEGYYFAFNGVNSVIADVEYECVFRAEEDKLMAQIILKDALNYTFYLKVEADGVLANLKLNGVSIDFASLEVKDIGGADYYVIPVELASFADIINDFTLNVDLVSGASPMTVTLAVAIDDYFAEVFEAGNEADAKMVYAIAEYVSALYEYFEYSFAYTDVRAKNLGRLNNLLADYAEYRTVADLPAENAALASAYIKSVSLVAKEQVTFAFRLADGFEGTVEVNGVEQAATQPFAGFARDYVLATVALEDLHESITVTVKDAEGELLESFTYALSDYVAGLAAQNEGVSGAYAKALWNLSVALG